MTAREEARLHLAKAREFLEAAETGRDLGLVNAAASDAVISAINSKDAICLAITGRTGKSDNHAQALDELRRSGSVGSVHGPLDHGDRSAAIRSQTNRVHRPR